MGTLETRQWLEAIRDDTDPLVLAEQACRVTEVLEAIYSSAASGETVRF
jgi:predicted dehydrogenase